MNVLYIGNMNGESNTCRFRYEVIKHIADHVDTVNTFSERVSLQYRLSNKLFNYGFSVKLPERNNENQYILNLIRDKKYDIVWVDKGITISKKTLETIKREQSKAVLVSFSLDNMIERHNQSQQYLEGFPIYDYHITTKSYIINQMYELGAKKVIFTYQGYEDSFHFPRKITEEDINRLGADVGFIGAWERERMESILYLTRNGIKVRVFGNRRWKQCEGDNPNLLIEDSVFNEDYAKAFSCFKICLCFLRKINKDLHTSRTMEIPACGGFMLAERTIEHLELFEEGKEAEFFSDDDELLRKCQYYLTHDKEREVIAKAGHERCLSSGYSNTEIISRIIHKIL